MVAVSLVGSCQSEKDVLRAATAQSGDHMKYLHRTNTKNPITFSSELQPLKRLIVTLNLIGNATTLQKIVPIAYLATLETSARSTTGSASFDVR